MSNAAESRTPRILVALATYNEAGNIEPLLRSIREFAPTAELLVVDDNSPDGTGQLVEQLKCEMSGVHVVHREGKQGLGTAILAAMRFAIEGGYDLFINLDADFSHPPRFIPDLIAGMDEHDVMIGSRYIPGGGVQSGFGWSRRFMSAGINWYSRLFLGLKSKDNSGSYRCYRVRKLQQIDFTKVRSRGYSFMEEILFWCKVVGSRIGETPILFEDRRAGSSKINKREAVKALQILAGLGVDRMLGRIRAQG
jgi:dolichol-phosphate mannosyltransferase